MNAQLGAISDLSSSNFSPIRTEICPIISQTNPPRPDSKIVWTVRFCWESSAVWQAAGMYHSELLQEKSFLETGESWRKANCAVLGKHHSRWAELKEHQCSLFPPELGRDTSMREREGEGNRADLIRCFSLHKFHCSSTRLLYSPKDCWWSEKKQTKQKKLRTNKNETKKNKTKKNESKNRKKHTTGPTN